jgi:stearoyl-CoA desaturase (delta-9 desaturase)
MHHSDWGRVGGDLPADDPVAWRPFPHPPSEARPDMTSKTSHTRKTVSHPKSGKPAKGDSGHAEPHSADPGWSSHVDVDSDEFAYGRSAIGGPESREQSPADLATLEAAELPRRPAVQHWSDLDWPVVLWIVLIHAAALTAPFYFTWSGLAICLALCWATGSLGVCLGYHRLLTHGSFSTSRPVKMFYAWMGGVSGEGSALHWVANHRKHHAFSDLEGDPHTPNDGGVWSHILWMFPRRDPQELDAHCRRWAPDLYKDPGILFLHKTFLLWHFLIGAALLYGGATLYDWRTGISWLVWGLAVRMVYVFHVTWFVNSATHIWGYRNYETTDNSRNLWWVGLLAFGEGWHNNHHAFQRMAKHGHRWWEVDTTYWVILGMEKLGLAWNVVKTPRGGRTTTAS